MAGKRKESYSVGELTQYIKFLLEENDLLRGVWVSGEVSNLTRHSSGHVYFTLKDEEAQLATVMFRGYASRVSRFPENGERVLVKGNITVYPPRGNYQMIATEIHQFGLGDLHQRFLELKEKLTKEGVFAPEHKQPIPKFPQKIGVATSPTGAAIKDIIDTIKRRFPHVTLVMAPTTVQGVSGKASIIHSLKALNNIPGIDLIILARGGGSLEDLWCFNEEAVARAIYDSSVPVITGVGHETDFTIADFTADLRAATPTAAAEQSVPDVSEIRNQLKDAGTALTRSLKYFIDFRRQLLDDYFNRIVQGPKSKLEKSRNDLNLFKAQMEALDMRNVLDRGYSITMKSKKMIQNAKELAAGDRIETVFSKGRSVSVIEEVTKDEG